MSIDSTLLHRRIALLAWSVQEIRIQDHGKGLAATTLLFFPALVEEAPANTIEQPDG